MKRMGLFKKLLIFLISACLLTAALSVIIYRYTALNVFSNRIADEMLPRAWAIARLSGRYIEGQIGFDPFREFVTDDLQPKGGGRGSTLYIYDSQGSLFAFSYSADGKMQELGGDYAVYVNAILTSGEAITDTRLRQIDCILVGVPIYDNLNRVSGAVILTKPGDEVYQAMASMTLALLTSCILASSLMLVVAYAASRKFTNPIRHMTGIATAMASGDFSARADELAGGEVGQLGHALNFLSGELSTTIGDLIIARNRLTTILAGLSEGVVALDEDFDEITYTNPAAQALLKNGAQALLLHGGVPFDVKALCASVAASGTPRAETIQLDESRLRLSFSVSPQEASGLKPGIVILIQDVTEAERLEQTRRDYVANVSHELRTPIASIRSLAEALNDGLVKKDEDLARYYGYILRESLRLSRLINDLLELSRLQSGTVALEKSRFDLSELLAEVAERMRMTASYSDITLRYEKKPLPEVFSNRDRVEQVLVALVDNAIKYASDDGAVTLSAVPADGRLLVEVRNSGHIDEADLSHLFERFYKADRAHSGAGTGLGLAIAHEVLQQLGETVEAVNAGDEVVFRFTVALPA